MGNDWILYLSSLGKKSIKSCTSLNPGNPDSDNHNQQSPNIENVISMKMSESGWTGLED